MNSTINKLEGPADSNSLNVYIKIMLVQIKKEDLKTFSYIGNN